MEGIGCISLRQPFQYEHFDHLKEVYDRYGNDEKAVEFIRSKQPVSLLEKYKAANITHFKYMEEPDLYGPLTYDAVMTVALGACGFNPLNRRKLQTTETPAVSNMSYFFTGPQLFESMRVTSFSGASNHVSYIPGTCSRDYSHNMLFMSNLRRDAALDSDGNVNFKFHVTSEYAKPADATIEQKSQWKTLNEFYFNDGRSVPPLDLPQVEETVLSISTAALAGGLVMASLAMILGILCFVGTIWFRNQKIVRASQPIFMCMICFGCIIISASVIPMSLQNASNTRILDMACMTTPWLLCVGFVTSFSVLFAKTLRLNKVRIALPSLIISMQDNLF